MGIVRGLSFRLLGEEMKLLSLFLASSSLALEGDDGSDKGIYSNYGSYGSYSSYGSYGGGYAAGKFINEEHDNGTNGRKGNGLWCYECHGRADLSGPESVTNNAWLDCVTNGAVKECWGDQRSCLSEERRRNDRTVEVLAKCKNPEACMYLWRRNERYMPPFHLFADQSEGPVPEFFDDECRINGFLNPNLGKHMHHRAQWEDTCRHCCAAEFSASNPGNGGACNSAERTGVTDGPIGHYCGGTADCSGWIGSNVAHYIRYKIIEIPVFMGLPMAFNRAHPGEGRNSLPEDKFVDRKNAGGGLLVEQADRLSPEDTDFHNDRQFVISNNGGFGTR